MINSWLIVILSIISLFVIYWVLFGERKSRQLIHKSKINLEDKKLVEDIFLLPDNKLYDLCVKKLKPSFKIPSPPYMAKEKKKLAISVVDSYRVDAITKAIRELNNQ